MRSNAATFISGRLAALFVLIAFQVVVVRSLPPLEYASFALVFAYATLMQTVVSFGIPRLIPRLMAHVGVGLTHSEARRLAIRLLAFRLAASFVTMVLGFAVVHVLGLTGRPNWPLVIVAGTFILVGVIQIDADAMAQSLGLQRVSRNCLVGEACARLAIVLFIAHQWHADTAASVLVASMITGAVASCTLFTAVLRTLSQPDGPRTAPKPTFVEFRSIALGGYASSMAWFASSPAVLRVIGSRMLAVTAFAGYAFMQNMVFSFQRYTPGALLFPFVEPTVMRDYLRTQAKERLAAALSLTTKADIIFVGSAVIGAVIAGPTIIDLLTQGRYDAYAFVLPYLLIYIVATSIYRSFEIVAIIVGASATLMQGLLISIVWLGAALLLVPHFGLIALLLCPLGDACVRLTLLYVSLSRRGMRNVLDLRVAMIVVILAAACATAGREIVVGLVLGRAQTILVGVLASFFFMCAVVLLRPLRAEETGLIEGAKWKDRLRILQRR